MSVYIYIYIYRERDIHIYIYIHTNTYTYTYTYTYTSIYIYIYIHTYIHIAHPHLPSRRPRAFRVAARHAPQLYLGNGLGVHQRGVQSEGGAADGGSII